MVTPTLTYLQTTPEPYNKSLLVPPAWTNDTPSRSDKNILHILDTHPQISITIEWVPGHRNIPGNNMADRLAKQGARTADGEDPVASYAWSRNSWKHTIMGRWKKRWEERERGRRSDFTAADSFPPQFSPTARLQHHSRETFSRLVQVRTGHAFTGDYYSKFVPTEDKSCPCGRWLQTRDHIISDCPLYEDHRHLLGEGGNRAIGVLLGTEEGIERLASFIEASGAFRKGD